jgi:GTP-binding protein
MSIYHRACYAISAHKLSQAPEDVGLEVAFAGRSNAGKSSAINAITAQKSLARTSKTPGRTQQIIFFTLDEHRRLVDLPGYGYAKVPLKIQQHWQHTLELYLQNRHSLEGLMLLVDIRRPLTDHDLQMLTWCVQADMPAHVLLTKADKMSKGQGLGVLQATRAALLKQWGEAAEQLFSLQLFSALKRTGIEQAQQQLDHWLQTDVAL